MYGLYINSELLGCGYGLGSQGFCSPLQGSKSSVLGESLFVCCWFVVHFHVRILRINYVFKFFNMFDLNIDSYQKGI